MFDSLGTLVVARDERNGLLIASDAPSHIIFTARLVTHVRRWSTRNYSRAWVSRLCLSARLQENVGSEPFQLVTFGNALGPWRSLSNNYVKSRISDCEDLHKSSDC